MSLVTLKYEQTVWFRTRTSVCLLEHQSLECGLRSEGEVEDFGIPFMSSRTLGQCSCPSGWAMSNHEYSVTQGQENQLEDILRIHVIRIGQKDRLRRPLEDSSTQANVCVLPVCFCCSSVLFCPALVLSACLLVSSLSPASLRWPPLFPLLLFS